MKTDKSFHFQTWGSMVDFCRNAKACGSDRDSRNDDAGAYGFYLSSNWDENLKMAVTGWDEMARQASTMARPHYRKISNLVQQDNINYGVEGHGIDVARFVEGIPECMQVFEPVINPGKSNRVLSMVVNVGALGGVSSGTMSRKGGYALALMDLLELSGYRVGVQLYSRADNGDQPITVTCQVKAPDQAPDKSRLAYIMAHPSVLRRLIFSIRETLWTDGGGSGSTVEYEPEPGEIYIPSGNFFNKIGSADIENMLLTELEKYGVLNTSKAR